MFYKVCMVVIIITLTIYIQKFLDSDWLKEMQFLGNTMQCNLVQKMGNSVQKNNNKQTGHSDQLINKVTRRVNQSRTVDWTNTTKQNGGSCWKIWLEHKHIEKCTCKV